MPEPPVGRLDFLLDELHVFARFGIVLADLHFLRIQTLVLRGGVEEARSRSAFQFDFFPLCFSHLDTPDRTIPDSAPCLGHFSAQTLAHEPGIIHKIAQKGKEFY